MSDRLTSDWTETAEEAFGETGRQGTEGELIACKILEDMGMKISYHPSDRDIQVSGIDIYIGSRGIDVKANLHSHKLQVAVEYPKLKKSQAQWWMHVDINNPGDFIMYDVEKMLNYIHDNNIRPSGPDELCWVNQKAAGEL